MSKAKVMSATLVFGIATTGAHAAHFSDDDLITSAHGLSDDILISNGFELHGDIAPTPHRIGDDWDTGIKTAQTCCGTPAQDTIQGSTGSAKKPAKGITLDNGIKKKGKLKPQQAGAKKKKKKN